MPDKQDRPVVIASNRGPLTHHFIEGRPVARRGGGGLVSGLAPLVESGRATWIAAALNEADRVAAREGVTSAGDLSAHLLDLDPEDHRLAYDVISNDYVDMLGAGILVPVKVTRSAVENAASIAAMILTTSALVCDIPEEKPAMPAGGGGMGMDM